MARQTVIDLGLTGFRHFYTGSQHGRLFLCYKRGIIDERRLLIDCRR